MRLGLNIRFLGRLGDVPPPQDSAVLVGEAERLGFSTVWVAEAFSSDAVSVLGWLAAQTTRIGLGSAVMQIPARSPAMTAMTAATLDLLSGGRFRLGLGVSGPQVAEGWHGQSFDHPLARTREYVEVVRMALQRQPVSNGGPHYPAGSPVSLRLGMRPLRRRIPTYLAAVGPRNTELAGEIADGWLAVFFQPEHAHTHLDHLRAGLRRAGRDERTFDVVAAVPVMDDGDRTSADRVRTYTANYLGGMGSPTRNFYLRHAERTGFGPAARAVQRAYLDGNIRAAVAAVPDALLDSTCLRVPGPRLAERLRAYADAGVTTLAATLFSQDVTRGTQTLRALADALDKSGVGE